MSEKQTSQRPKGTSASTSGPHPDLQKAFDAAEKRGYFGETPDTTPNAAYTVAGVVKIAKKKD